MSTLFYERRQMTLGDLGKIPDFIAPTEGIRIERCRIPDICHILRIFRRDFRNFIAGRRTERNPIDIILVFHTEIIRRFYGITVGKTHNRIHSVNIGIVAVFFKHNIDTTETIRYCVLIQRGYTAETDHYAVGYFRINTARKITIIYVSEIMRDNARPGYGNGLTVVGYSDGTVFCIAVFDKSVIGIGKNRTV